MKMRARPITNDGDLIDCQAFIEALYKFRI